MANPVQIQRDTAFEAAVHLLRQSPEGYLPPALATGAAETLPDDKFKQRIQWMAERIPARSRVLDLGCGKGEMLHFLIRKKQVDCLGLDRDLEFLAACRRLGLPAVPSDFNNLADPALRFACSQHWDTVLIIDTLVYWRCPAVVLAALQDRCQRLFISVSNAAKFQYRWQAFLGNNVDLPNVRGHFRNGQAKFSTEWFSHHWTINGFQTWGDALGYTVKPVARRSIRAKYSPLGILPGLFARSVLFELIPRKL